eukprot:6168329-Lingulodinium_polyedra.AAC.1
MVLTVACLGSRLAPQVATCSYLAQRSNTPRVVVVWRPHIIHRTAPTDAARRQNHFAIWRTGPPQRTTLPAPGTTTRTLHTHGEGWHAQTHAASRE